VPHDRRPAGQRVRLALVGFGYWGPNYARVLSDLPDVDLIVVCDRRPDRLRLAEQKYRTVATCERVEELFARGDVDGIVLATPASTHEALVLCDLADTCGRILMVGYTFLYNAGVRKMKEETEPGLFGQPYYMHATRTNLGPIRQDVNAVWDLAPHDIAIFNYLAGEQPLWASATGTRVLKTSREDIAFATLGYTNDVVGNIHVSWADPNKVREVVAVGSRRRVVFNDLNDVERVRVFERGVSAGDAIVDSYGEFKLLVREGDIISPKLEASEPLKNQCADFVNAIVTGQPPLADGRFGIGVIRALTAIDASMRLKGAAVEV
jgi:predicted dehydrogenase